MSEHVVKVRVPEQSSSRGKDHGHVYQRLGDSPREYEAQDRGFKAQKRPSMGLAAVTALLLLLTCQFPWRAASLQQEAGWRRSKRRGAALIATACLLLVLLTVFPQVELSPAAQAGKVAAEASTAARLDSEGDHFVKIVNGEFVVNCKKFYVSGWNQWEVVEAAAGALELFGATLPEGKTGPQLIRSIMDKAVQHGLTVMRTWAHTVTAQYSMQSAPGQYNEAVLRGLDYALDEARKRGLRVLLSLTDNWQPNGGADQFVNWSGTGRRHEDFFTDPNAKRLYKQHVKTILTRVNTINGRSYKDDPTIFGWNLINEPRCYQCGNALELWVNEMAAYVKSIDSNHLLTVGEEGFYPRGLPQSEANPQGLKSWAFSEGQNFVRDHASPNIDFMAFHWWGDNWLDKSPDFARRWVRQHIADAAALGKPLLLEEFGKWGSGAQRPERDDFMRIIYEEIAASTRQGGPAKGAMFWQWYDKGQRAPAEEGGTVEGLYGIFDTDSTWSVIQNFTDEMNRLSGSTVAGSCTAGSASVPAVVDACTATRVAGRSDTGYEGPRCGQDINECVRGTSGCHPDATCANAPGFYTCRCPPGYTGDGFSCSKDEVQHRSMTQQYSTQGPGKLACSEGKDVLYPEAAPGFAYDPIGALEQSPDRRGGLGSRMLVEPEDCMMACDLAQASGCDSFSYNPEQKKCFLKAVASTSTCQAKETVCTSARGQPYSCGTWQTYYRQAAGAAQTVPLVQPATNSSLANSLATGFNGSASPQPPPQLLPPLQQGTQQQVRPPVATQLQAPAQQQARRSSFGNQLLGPLVQRSEGPNGSGGRRRLRAG